MRLSDTRFLLALALPSLTAVSLLTEPQLAWICTLAIWGGIALLDALVPDAQNSPAALPDTASLAYFSWVLRLFVPLQMVLIAVGAYAAAQGDWLLVLGLAFSVGFISGSQGITFAHELGHGKSKLDRFCGWVLMTSVCYGHFMVEHYRGHHPRAASFEDAASARRGESLYAFWPRTVWGSFISGWRLEAARIVQMKSSWLKSPLAWSFALPLLVFLAIVTVMPPYIAIKVIVFLLLQSLVAFTLLEIVNYIEHYGLQRNMQGNRREPFGMMHAWNADHVITNSLLVNLQRHSDHHMHAWKPYPTLEPLPGPQLPTGYAGCLFLAMCTPLWFKLMHKRLDDLAAQAARMVSAPVKDVV